MPVCNSKLTVILTFFRDISSVLLMLLVVKEKLSLSVELSVMFYTTKTHINLLPFQSQSETFIRRSW